MMKTWNILALIALIAVSLAVPVTHAQDHPTTAEHPKQAELPIKAEHAMSATSLVGVAASAGEFSTFVTAVEAAGLMGKLQGEGPFTVFAPTNAAFAKLPKADLASLLEPANKSKLAGILACHVVPGKIMAADVKTMKATNVSGQDLAIEVKDGVVMVEGAKVVKADLEADNGVIHAIDTVIIPSGEAKSASDKPKDHPAH
jgi:uncharacterized surface protein with fasciclin (FAS1) repeats